jgi:ABC-type branched-subunit amino acid transport system ATPase component
LLDALSQGLAPIIVDKMIETLVEKMGILLEQNTELVLEIDVTSIIKQTKSGIRRAPRRPEPTSR